MKKFLTIISMFFVLLLIVSCGGGGENPLKDINASFSNAVFTYDGNEHSIFVSGDIPSDVTVSYENNGHVDVGNYVVTAKFSTTSKEYNLPETLTANLVIVPASLNINDFSFSDLNVTYDGDFHSIFVKGNIPSNIEITYSGNNQKEVGTYTVSATIKDKNGNFSPVTITATITITLPDEPAFSLEDQSFTYDGQPHSLSISGDLGNDFSVRYEGNNQVNVGNYQVRAIVTDNRGIHDDMEYTATLTINKGDITGYELVSKSFGYDGQLHSLKLNKELDNNLFVSYVNNEQTNVGTYTVRATISDRNGNYNDLSLLGTLEITKADYPGEIEFEDQEFVFDGERHSIKIGTELPSNFEVTYTSNNKTEVGTYIVVATITDRDGNYNTFTKSATMTITARPEHGYVLESQTFVYDGNPHSLTLNKDINDNQKLEFENNNQTNAGTYNVTARIKDKNGVEEDIILTAELIILKAQIGHVHLDSKTITYDGQAHFIELQGTLPEGVNVAYRNNDKVNAGEYQVIAALTDTTGNYISINLQATLTITKANYIGEFTLEDNIVEYDGQPHTIEYSGELPEFFEVIYPTTKYVEVGEYPYSVTLRDRNGNYNDIVLNAMLVIRPAKELEFEFNSNTFIYNGQPHSLALSGDIPARYQVSYVGNDQINAGEYTVKAVIKDTLTLKETVKEATLTIRPAELTGLSMTAKTVTYDGERHSILVDGNIPEGVEVNYTNNDVIDAGDYLVTAILSSLNYEGKVLDARLTIEKATLQVVFEDAIVTYDGNPHRIFISSGLPDEIDVEYSNTTGFVDKGTYTITAYLSSNKLNYNYPSELTATLTIVSAGPEVTIQSQEVEYDGQPHSVGHYGDIPEGINFVLEGNNQTDAGVYTVVGHFYDENNKEVYPTVEGTLTITKAPYNFNTVIEEARFTYDGQSHSVTVSGEMPEGATIQYSGNSQTEAGDYYAYALITSKNYTDKEIHGWLHIDKAEFDDYSINDLEYQYDGKSHAYVFENEVPEGTVVNIYGNDNVVNAGTYNISIDLINSNYETKYIYFTIRINPILIDLTMPNETIVYDGLSHTMLVTGEYPNDVSVTYMNNVHTDMGTYEVTAFINTDNPNYSFTTTTLYATMTIKLGALKGTMADATYEYNENEPHSLEVVMETPYDYISYSQEGVIDAGVYEITATVYKADCDPLELKATLTITPKMYEFSFTDEEYHYTGYEQEKTIWYNLDFPYYIVKIEYTNNKHTDIGVYECKVRVYDPKGNYATIEKTATVTIVKGYTPGYFDAYNHSFEYDGQPHCTALIGYDAEFVINYKFYLQSDTERANALAGMPVNVGKYHVIAEITDPRELYEDATLESDFEIKKVKLTLPRLDGGYYDYDGQPHYPTFVDEIPAELTITYGGDEPINVGSHYVTVRVTDPNGNYDIEYYNGGNYTGATIHISPAPMPVKFESQNFAYDGQPHSIEIEGDLPAGISVTYSGNGQTEIGEYTVTASFSSTDSPCNYDTVTKLYATLTIAGQVLNASDFTFENQTITYDGNAHSILAVYNNGTLPESVTIEYTNNSQTNAGVYEIKAHFTSTDSTLALPADMKATLTIERANIDFTFERLEVTYDGLEHEIVISPALPENFTVTYANNKGTNPGTYSASVTIEEPSGNYNVGTYYAELVILANDNYAKVRFQEKVSGSWKTIHTIYVLKGESIPEAKIPTPTPKTGYNVWYDYELGTVITEDTIIKAKNSVIEYQINYEIAEEIGTLSSNNPTTYSVLYGEIYLNNPDMKHGYSFIKWVDKDNNDAEVTVIDGSDMRNYNLRAVAYGPLVVTAAPGFTYNESMHQYRKSVPVTTTSLDLSDVFTVTTGATYTVYQNSQPAAGNVVTISEGNNYLSMNVTKDGYTTVYNILITTSPVYHYTFTVNNQVYLEGDISADEVLQMPEGPERTGYTFVRWDGNITTAGKITANTTFTAIYSPNSTTVTIHWNNNTETTEERTITYSYGYVITAPYGLAKTGHTFVRLEYNGEEFPMSGDWNRTEETMTLEGVWTPNTYVITYESNARGFVSYTQDVVYGSSYELHHPDLPGYTFASYNMTASGTWTTASNTTVQVNYSGNTYSITYLAGSGTSNVSLLPTEFNYHNGLSLSSYQIFRYGYTFDAFYVGNDRLVDNNSYYYPHNVVVELRWSPVVRNVNYYEVTKDSSGNNIISASPVHTDQNVSADDAYSLYPARDITGFVFNRYSRSVDEILHYYADTDVDVYIYYNKAIYNIIYELNGGSVDSNARTTYDYLDGYVIADAMKTGHDFLGWYLDDEFKTELYNSNGMYILQAGTHSGDLHLYAKFTPSVIHVRFESNYINSFVGYGRTDTFTYGEAFSLYEETIPGYDFINYTISGSVVVPQSGSAYTYSTWGSVENPTIITLNYVIKKYSISYVLNGGIIPENETNRFVDTYYGNGNLYLSKLTKEGYHFLGWSKTETYQGEVPYPAGNAASVQIDINSDTTLYAIFEARVDEVNNYTGTIFFDEVSQTYQVYKQNKPYGYNANNYPKLSFTYDENYTLTHIDYTGYTFEGFLLEINYNNQAQIEIDDFPATGKWTIEGHLYSCIYAKYKPIAYEINYNLDPERGETNHSHNNEYYYYGNDALALYEPTKTGYNFLGWFLDSNYQTEVGKVDYTYYLAAHTYTDNITLYPKFEAKTLEYYLRDGDTVDVTKQITYDQAYDLNSLVTVTGKHIASASITYNNETINVPVAGDKWIYEDSGGKVINIVLEVNDTEYTITYMVEGVEVTNIRQSIKYLDPWTVQTYTIPEVYRDVIEWTYNGATFKPGQVATYNQAANITLVGNLQHVTYDCTVEEYTYPQNTKKFYRISSYTGSLTDLTIYPYAKDRTSGNYYRITSIKEDAIPATVTRLTLAMGTNETGLGAASSWILNKNALRNATALEYLRMDYLYLEHYTLGSLFGGTTGADLTEANNTSVPTTLTEVVIDNATAIRAHYFDGCSHLVTVRLPGMVTYFGDDAFKDCALTNIYYGNTVDYWMKNVYCYDSPFRDTEHFYFQEEELVNLVVDDENITSIGRDQFGGLSTLKTVRLGSHVTEVLDYAFTGCSNLESIIMDAVVTIGSMSFAGCKDGLDVVIPSTVTSMRSYSFDAIDNINLYYDGTMAQFVNIGYGFHTNPLRNTARFYIKDNNGNVTFNNNNYTEFNGTINIADGTTELKHDSFEGIVYDNLELHLPSTVTYLASGLFSKVVSKVYYDGTINDVYKLFKNRQYEPINWVDNTTTFYIKENNEYVVLDKLVMDENITAEINKFKDVTTLEVTTNVTTIDASSFGMTLKIENVYYDATLADWMKVNVTGKFEANSFRLFVKDTNNGMVSFNGNTYSEIKELTFASLEEVPNYNFCNMSLDSLTLNANTILNTHSFEGSSITALNAHANNLGILANASVTTLTISGGADVDLSNASGVITNVVLPTSATKVTYKALKDSITNLYYQGGIEEYAAIDFTGHNHYMPVTNYYFSANNNPETTFNGFGYNGVPSTLTIGAGKSVGAYAFAKFTFDEIIIDPSARLGSNAFSLANITKVEAPAVVLDQIGFEHTTDLYINGGDVLSAGKFGSNNNETITKLRLSNSVRTIAENAFIRLVEIDDVYYDGSVVEWATISFGNEKANPAGAGVHLYVLDKEGKVSYGDNTYSLVTELEMYSGSVSNYAFCNTDLDVIVLGNSVTASQYSFKTVNAANMTTAVMNATVFNYLGSTSIDNVTITGGSAITLKASHKNLTIPATITEVTTNANSNGVEDSIMFGGGIADWISIDFGTKSPMTNTTKLYVKANNQYQLVTKVVIPNNTEYVGYSLAVLGNITAMVIPSGVKDADLIDLSNVTTLDIDAEVFAGLTFVGLMENINIISGNEFAMYENTYVTNLVLPATLQSINSTGNHIENLYLNMTLQEYLAKEQKDVSLFANATNIYLKDANGEVTYLGQTYSLFDDENFVLPEGIKVFPSYKLDHMTHLNNDTIDSMYLPSTLQTIEANIFSEFHPYVTNLYFSGTLDEWKLVDDKHDIFSATENFYVTINGEHALVKKINDEYVLYNN